MSAPEARFDIVWAQTFLASMAKLPATHQAAVLEAMGKLQRGHGSTHLHALAGMRWVSFCVSKDAVRVICEREGSTLVLAWADFHDDAYRWAERRRPERFGLAVRFVKVDVDDAVAPRVADAVAPPGPLVGVKDKSFRALEVGPRLATILRDVPDEDTLLELCTRLEKALAEALVALAADPDALDAIVRRFHEAKSGEASTLADAVKAPVNAESMWVVPPEQQSLRAALEGDAETWRVFLHPSQRRLVELETSGPYLVTGGPGTGKTVVALHRARHLAERLDDARPILLTTFSRVLAKQLDEGFRAVVRDQPAIAERITTNTLTGAARAVLERAKVPSALVVGEDLDACWDDALALDVDHRGRAFYVAEREQIVLPNGITSEEVYLKAPRPGRKERLDRTAKRRVWAVLSALEAAAAPQLPHDAGHLRRRRDDPHVGGAPVPRARADEGAAHAAEGALDGAGPHRADPRRRRRAPRGRRGRPRDAAPEQRPRSAARDPRGDAGVPRALPRRRRRRARAVGAPRAAAPIRRHDAGSRLVRAVARRSHAPRTRVAPRAVSGEGFSPRPVPAMVRASRTEARAPRVASKEGPT